MATDVNPPKSGKFRAVLPFAGVLLLGLGLGAGVSFAIPEPPPPVTEAPAAGAVGGSDEKSTDKADEGGHGGTADAEPEGEGGAAVIGGKTTAAPNPGTFTINLKGGGGGRILRLELQLQAAEADMEALEALKPLLRDTVLTAVSDYTWAELEGSDGKIRLKDELLQRMNGVTGNHKITALFLLQCVVS